MHLYRLPPSGVDKVNDLPTVICEVQHKQYSNSYLCFPPPPEKKSWFFSCQYPIVFTCQLPLVFAYV